MDTAIIKNNTIKQFNKLFTSKNKNRPTLTRTHVCYKYDNFTLYATDSYRISKLSLDIPASIREEVKERMGECFGEYNSNKWYELDNNELLKLCAVYGGEVFKIEQLPYVLTVINYMVPQYEALLQDKSAHTDIDNGVCCVNPQFVYEAMNFLRAMKLVRVNMFHDATRGNFNSQRLRLFKQFECVTKDYTAGCEYEYLLMPVRGE